MIFRSLLILLMVVSCGHKTIESNNLTSSLLQFEDMDLDNSFAFNYQYFLVLHSSCREFDYSFRFNFELQKLYRTCGK